MTVLSCTSMVAETFLLVTSTGFSAGAVASVAFRPLGRLMESGITISWLSKCWHLYWQWLLMPASDKKTSCQSRMASIRKVFTSGLHKELSLEASRCHLFWGVLSKEEWGCFDRYPLQYSLLFSAQAGVWDWARSADLSSLF